MSKGKGRQYHARRRRRVKFILNIIKILILLAALYCIAAYTPVLKLANIYIENTQIVTPDEVAAAAAIPQDINILRINRREAIKKIEKIPYVSKAEIKYSFPNNIKIVITEGSIYYSFKTADGYYNTDENLKCLEITPQPKVLPVIENIGIVSAPVGEKITIDETEKFDIILMYYNILKERNYIDKVSSMSIDEYSVSLRLKSGVLAKCGTSSDAERKIAALKASIDECIESNGQEPKIGTFDLSDPKQVVYSID